MLLTELFQPQPFVFIHFDLASLSCPELIKAYESQNDEYEVEKIVGEKVEYGARHFLVKWKGWAGKFHPYFEYFAIDSTYWIVSRYQLRVCILQN